MNEEGEEREHLRVGPWVPDPPTGPRPTVHGRRHFEPAATGVDAVGRRTDPLSTADLVHADERGWQRRDGQGRTRRRWILMVALVVGLGAVASVPLLRAGPHAPPATATVPVVSAPADAPIMTGSDEAEPGPTADPSPAAPSPTPSAVPSRPVARVPPPRPFTAAYEAEDPANTLGGTAWVDDYPGASGGRIVRNLGNWEGSREAGSLRFNNVTVPRTGSYVLTLFYVHLDDTATRTAVVEVSGSAPVSITVTGSATCCTAARLQITLQQGTNTITFTNRDDHAPSMDRITVSST